MLSWLESLTHNQVVLGSSPSGTTSFKSSVYIFFVSAFFVFNHDKYGYVSIFYVILFPFIKKQFLFFEGYIIMYFWKALMYISAFQKYLNFYYCRYGPLPIS